jgi:hypothetical protein
MVDKTEGVNVALDAVNHLLVLETKPLNKGKDDSTGRHI